MSLAELAKLAERGCAILAGMNAMIRLQAIEPLFYDIQMVDSEKSVEKKEKTGNPQTLLLCTEYSVYHQPITWMRLFQYCIFNMTTMIYDMIPTILVLKVRNHNEDK